MPKKTPHFFLPDVRDRYEAEYPVARIHFHEGYNVGPYLNNDLALVQIKPDSAGGGIAFGPHVSPVCLPSEDFLYTARTNVTITGWGKVKRDLQKHYVDQSCNAPL